MRPVENVSRVIVSHSSLRVSPAGVAASSRYSMSVGSSIVGGFSCTSP